MESYREDEGEEKLESAPDIITHVSVGKMTGHDSDHLAPAIEDAKKRDICPDALTADSHYGYINNMDHAAGEDAEHIALAMPPRGYKKKRLTLENFQLDEDGCIKRWPAKVRGGYARVQYTHARLRQCRRRIEQGTKEFQDRYRRRAGIEATMSRLKYQMKLAGLRERGMAAVKYTVFLRALGINIFRCAAVLRAAVKEERRGRSILDCCEKLNTMRHWVWKKKYLAADPTPPGRQPVTGPREHLAKLTFHFKTLKTISHVRHA